MRRAEGLATAGPCPTDEKLPGQEPCVATACSLEPSDVSILGTRVPWAIGGLSDRRTGSTDYPWPPGQSARTVLLQRGCVQGPPHPKDEPREKALGLVPHPAGKLGLGPRPKHPIMMQLVWL